MGSRKHVLTASAALVLMVTAAFYAVAQQAGDAKKSAAAPAIGKRHSLAATLETVQLGLARSEGTTEAHRGLGRHGLGRDDDALAREDASGDHDR